MKVLFIFVILIVMSGCATPQADWDYMEPSFGRQNNAPVTHQFIKNRP